MHNQQLSKLEKSFRLCLLKDRFPFKRKLQTIRSNIKNKKPVDKAIDSLSIAVEKSINACQSREQNKPVVSYPEELPVSQKRKDIIQAIHDNQVIVICGETGSGKTTQIPKICMELGRGVTGTIGHTQPRRIAARTVAARIAEEIGLTSIYLLTFSYWMMDRSQEQRKTRRFLTRRLQQNRLFAASKESGDQP